MKPLASGPRIPIRLALLVQLGLALRVLAADAAQWMLQRRGGRWLFPDTDIYWKLGAALAEGRPYEVSQWGVPHFALRTPGYPLWLAAFQSVFGDRTMPVRLGQAFLGAGCVVLAFALARRSLGTAALKERGAWALLFAALVGAGLTAVDPYTVGFSVVLLSEAVFLPFMLLGLLGLSAIWATGVSEAESKGRFGALAVGTGCAWGCAVLVKPSWALFPPAALAVWVLAARGGRRRAVVGGALVVLGLSLVMGPWWVRNAEVFGRFVPTAVWTGASLYDGLNPSATGASDMTFLGEPTLWPLHEEAQDAALSGRAWAWARAHPGRALELGVVKAWRYVCPWPAGIPIGLKVVAAAWVLPIYALILTGVWDRRRDIRALLLLGGPLVYFAGIHLLFVSSIRYRVPALVPAFGLAGLGVLVWRERWARKSRAESLG